MATITPGSPLTFYDGSVGFKITFPNIKYDSVLDQVLLYYKLNSTAYFVAGTINSGSTDITWGTPVTTPVGTHSTDVVYLPSHGIWIGADPTYALTLYSVSSNIVTSGDYDAQSARYGICATSDGFLIIGRSSPTFTMYAKAGTVSGSLIVLGTQDDILFSSAVGYNDYWDIPAVEYDSVSDRCLLAYADFHTGYLSLCVINASGTTASAEIPTTVGSALMSECAMKYDVSTGKFILWTREGDDYLFRTVSISGNTATASSPITLGTVAEDGTHTNPTATMDTTSGYMFVMTASLGDAIYSPTISAVNELGPGVWPPIAINAVDTNTYYNPTVCYIPVRDILISSYATIDSWDGKYEFLTGSGFSQFWTNFKDQTESE